MWELRLPLYCGSCSAKILNNRIRRSALAVDRLYITDLPRVFFMIDVGILSANVISEGDASSMKPLQTAKDTSKKERLRRLFYATFT